VIGFVAGVVEALFSALPEARADYWRIAGIHYFQLGFMGWVFGLVGGHLVAKRVEAVRVRRRLARAKRGQCLECGYDLRGNESGKCPECGTVISAGPEP
jgi:hypothetical protein